MKTISTVLVSGMGSWRLSRQYLSLVLSDEDYLDSTCLWYGLMKTILTVLVSGMVWWKLSRQYLHLVWSEEDYLDSTCIWYSLIRGYLDSTCIWGVWPDWGYLDSTCIWGVWFDWGYLDNTCIRYSLMRGHLDSTCIWGIWSDGGYFDSKFWPVPSLKYWLLFESWHSTPKKQSYWQFKPPHTPRLKTQQNRLTWHGYTQRQK